MNILINHAMVVNGAMDQVSMAQRFATQVFDKYKLGSLVGGLLVHASNGGAAFFIAPDGGKQEGTTALNSRRARDELIVRLRNIRVGWVEVELGGDNNLWRVTRYTERS